MQFVQTAKRSLLGSSVFALGFASQAHAALPADVTTALSDAKADGVVAAGLVLGVIIAIAAFKFIRRAL